MRDWYQEGRSGGGAAIGKLVDWPLETWVQIYSRGRAEGCWRMGGGDFG